MKSGARGPAPAVAVSAIFGRKRDSERSGFQRGWSRADERLELGELAHYGKSETFDISDFPVTVLDPLPSHSGASAPNWQNRPFPKLGATSLNAAACDWFPIVRAGEQPCVDIPNVGYSCYGLFESRAHGLPSGGDFLSLSHDRTSEFWAERFKHGGAPANLSGKEDLLDVTRRNNVKVVGSGSRAMIFAHGFGCDQNMWRFVWPAFADEYRIVLFDHVGCGGSDLSAYRPDKYASLEGYAADVVDICRALEITHGVFVGHSVSAMIGAIASLKAPEVFDDLIMIGPSPRYINDGDYTGGFSEQQIHELLDFLDANHMGWSQAMAPVIMGNPDRPELGEELTNSFCMTDPDIARKFARVTFLSDNRSDLPAVKARCLVLQCSEDVIAPQAVGEYVASRLANSHLTLLNATGHCPNLSAPEETVAAMKAFLEGRPD